MEKTAIKTYLLGLPSSERIQFIEELQGMTDSEGAIVKCQSLRREILDNKQGCCAHCGHSKYVKFGIDKGSQRYKCKSCKRSFTAYSGTWMAGIHHKDKIDDYLELMLREMSLDKIKDRLEINKKTAFDWRHKVLSSIEEVKTGNFTGITESDETFFLFSEKGKEKKEGISRKRGGKSSKRGINDEHVAVIATQDRKDELSLNVVTTGRIKKIDIEKAIGHRVNSQTVLCTDSHVSYKGFAIDNELEHHALRSYLKERVRKGVYHIQHINSTHNRLKKWIENEFWGVATRYLQNYLNWFRIKEILKESRNFPQEFIKLSTQDTEALERYRQIPDRYAVFNASLN